MLRREYLLLLSWIESEDSSFVASVLVDMRCRLFASLTGVVGVAFVVLAFSYLYDSATALLYARFRPGQLRRCRMGDAREGIGMDKERGS